MKASSAVVTTFIIALSLSLLTPDPAGAGDVLTVDLNSGRHHLKVGTVEAEVEGGTLTVTYKADSGWKIYLTHLDVAGDAADLAQNKNGNPTPGRFAHKDGHQPAVEEYSYVLNLLEEGLDEASEIFIAAHAGLFHEVDPKKKKSAWAGDLDFAGRNWATYFVYVPSLNEPPVAIPDVITVNEDYTVVFNVLLNDYDPDGDPLAASLLTSPSNGTLVGFNSDGSCHYVPHTNFHGVDSFMYRASDPSGATDDAAVTIYVNPVNDAPVAILLSNNTVPENSPGAVIGTLTVIDADESDYHMLELLDGPGFVIMDNTLMLDTGVSLDYETQPTVDVLIRATDSGGASITEVLTIYVIDVPDF